MSDRSYFSRQVVLSPDSGLGQIPSRLVVNPNGASLGTVRQTLSDYDADIVYMYTRFRNETMRSGLGYVKRYYRHPLFEMIYRFNNGQERIDMIMTPEPSIGPPPLKIEEQNVDGYISAYVFASTFEAEEIGEEFSSFISVDKWWIWYFDRQCTLNQIPYFSPYIFYGTYAEAEQHIADNYTVLCSIAFPGTVTPIPIYTVYAWIWPAYDYRRGFRFKQLLQANAQYATPDDYFGTTYMVYAPSLEFYTAEQLGPPAMPELIFPPVDQLPPIQYPPFMPSGTQTYPAFPMSVNITVAEPAAEGASERVLNTVTVNPTATSSSRYGVVKIGPTALRARNEFTNPETSSGAEVDIAPPPPLPHSGAPSYELFEHSDDPATYQLKEYYQQSQVNSVVIPRGEASVSGQYKVTVEPTLQPYSSVFVSLTGEFFARNIVRDATSGFFSAAAPNTVVAVNDYPVRVSSPVLRYGQGAGYYVFNYQVVSSPAPQYEQSAVYTFDLAAIPQPIIPDPANPQEGDATTWGPFPLQMTRLE